MRWARRSRKRRNQATRNKMRPTEKQDGAMSFWDHLDVLRGSLLKIAVVTLACGAAAFCFKEEVFAVLLAPRDPDFVTYRLLERVSGWFGGGATEDFSIPLINTGLAEQLMIHLKVSVYAGFLVSSPYTLYLLFHFISPALYENERRYSSRVVVSGYAMFVAGVLASYFVLFPLTFRFLGTYQVSPDVENMITLQSYMGTFLMMNLAMGIVFELPVVCWLLGKLGILTAEFMRRFRRHAVVVILVAAALITPTTDMFTMLIVALPIWLLYEASILIVRRTGKAREEAEAEEA